MAALGATRIAFGKHPLKKPFNPSCIQIRLTQSITPKYCLFTTLISPVDVSSALSDLCCNLDFTTCIGYVAVVATLLQQKK